MFDKLKKKLRSRKHSKEPAKPTDPPPQNGNQAPSVVATQAPSSDNAVSTEKPVADSAQQQPVEQKPLEKQPVPAKSDQQAPEKPTAPARDLWQDAIDRLPESKREKIKNMKLDDLKSNSIKSGIDDIAEIVKQKQEQVEKKFWRVSIGDKDIVLRNYTTKIVGWLEKAGDIAVQFAPPQASLPWSLLKSIMQVPVIDNKQMAALLVVTEQVVRIITRGQVYEDVYLLDSPENPESGDKLEKQLEGGLVGIYTASLTLLTDSEELFSQNTAMRTLNAIMNPGSVSDGLTDLSTKEDELLRDVNACEAKRRKNADTCMVNMLDRLNAPLARVDDNVQQVLTRMDDEDRIKLLEWISPIKFGQDHNSKKTSRTPGTGEWLLQDENFCTWERTSSSGIFLLQGSAGTGKSYLTSRVVDLFQEQLEELPQDDGFAFFYCDKKDHGDALSILQSYVRQLSTATSNPESMRSKLQEICAKAREGGATLGFEACEDQIMASLNLYPSTTLILDALDECDLDSRDKLTEVFNSLVKKSKNPLKIFISSRPDPDMELQYSTGVAIQADHNKGDIQLFLEKQLTKVAKRAIFLRRMKKKVIEKLLERCQGMFQWAFLQVNQIRECTTEQSVWKALTHLPATLEAAYDQVWQKVEGFEEPDKTLAKRALKWVIAANKPMTSEVLLSAIRVGSKEDAPFLTSEIDERGLLKLCRGFLTIDSETKAWRFSHLSVMEYLEQKHHYSSAQAHCHAATVSLSLFLNAYENEDPTTMPERGTSNTEDPETDINIEDEENDEDYDDDYDDDEILGESISPFEIFDIRNPFHLYVRHHWVPHVHGSQSSEGSTVVSLLKEFFGAPEDSSVQYRRWLKQVEQDFEDSDDPIDQSGWDISGFDNGVFKKYENTFGFRGSSQWASELEPEDMAIFGMCRFAFGTILCSWWNNADIDLSRRNNRGHNLLAVAAMGGDVDTCKKLIQKGIPVNLQLENSNFGSAIIAASHKGQTPVVKALAEAGAEVNTSLKPPKGWFDCALAAAVDANRIETTRYLVNEAKADVNIPLRDVFYCCALGRPAYSGYGEIIECLVKAGADVNKPLDHLSFQSVLQLAVAGCNLDTFKFLVEYGKADVNIPLQGTRAGSILEHAVTAYWQFDVVRYLVEEANADLNSTSSESRYGSPLAAAAHDCGEPRMVAYLLEKGADANRPLKYGEFGSALIAAVHGDQFENVKLLVEAGADVNMAVTRGEFGSALAAIGCFQDIDFVDYLLQKGSDINMQLHGGLYGSALASAAYSNRLDLVKLFVEKGADVDMPLLAGKYGSALAAAAASDSVDTLKFLVEKGANVDKVLSAGIYGSALAAAVAQYSATESIKYLLSCGTDVNLPLSSGSFGSALAAAASEMKLEHVKLLVEAGADVNMPLHHGAYGSALAAVASNWNEVKVLKYLLEKGAHANIQLSVGHYGSPLAAAAAHNKIEALQCLMDAGAELNVPLGHGKFGSALAAAGYQGKREKLEFLLKAQADVNMELNTDCGNALTAYAAYAENDDPECVDLLIEADANVNPKSPVGKYGCPLIAAAYFGRKENAERLIKGGADVNLRFDSMTFATALEATQAAVSEEEMEGFRQRRDDDVFVAKQTQSLREGRDQVAELLQQHGATA